MANVNDDFIRKFYGICILHIYKCNENIFFLEFHLCAFDTYMNEQTM